MQFAIFEGNMPALEKKIKRIENKCKRYGCSFRFEQVGEEFRTFQVGVAGYGEPIEVVRRFVLVDAEGEARLNGWKFVCTLEHTDAGNIVHSVEDAPDIPSRYYHCAPYCEHCKTSRERKQSFIVQNEETGEFKQVGGSCLKDFTFGMSAVAVTDWMSMFDDLRKAEEVPESFGGRLESYYRVEEMLTYFVEAVNKFGYTRSSEPNPTSYVGFTLWERDHGKLSDNDKEYHKDILEEAERRGFRADTEQNHKTAQECIAWGRALEGESNYAQNLRTICGCEYTKARNLGLLASVLPSMNKDLERQAERRERERKAQEEAKTSEHVGNVGDRITVKVAEHTVLASWDTDWGFTSLHKFVDEQGNVYTWKTGNLVPDDVKSIKGTVKAHNEFRGVKQTELTRCKIS